MLAIYVFQVLLNAIGWALAKTFDLVGNFGVAIIVLTIVIRVVLLPLGIKQIKSMQAMQAIQPKIKELQKKYKGNKQRAQEETMKLYKEAGVNPLGGCLPLLLQFPILIAMYAVLRPPQLLPATVGGQQVYEIHNNHLPVDSKLFQNVILYQNLGIVGIDLQCSAAQGGTDAAIVGTDRKVVQQNADIRNVDGTPFPFHPTTGSAKIDCGSSGADKVPYFLLLAAMIATMFYQQRQMQRASPPGAASSQQQALLYLMPVMFGFFGYAFPAGLNLYWAVTNVLTIGQQYGLLKAGHIGPEAMERRMNEQRAKNAGAPGKKGFMARMQDRAEEARREQTKGKPKPKSGRPASGNRQTGTGRKPTGGAPGSAQKGPQPRRRRPNIDPKASGGSAPPGPKPRKPEAGGSGDTGDGEAGS